MYKAKITIDNIKGPTNLYNDVLKALDEEIRQACANTVSDTNTLDSDIPVIAGSTSFNKEDDHTYNINKGGGLQHPEMAVYSEFGTGDYAGVLLSSYPQDWKEMAMKFFVNGLGRLPAKPALYPSYRRHFKDIDKKVAQRID